MQKERAVLVTGALGFLGRTAIQMLVDSNYFVWGLDLPGTEIPPVLKNLESTRFKFIEGNILNDGLIERIPKNIDCVIHLAGLAAVEKSFDESDIYEKVNVEGTVRILEACKSRGIKRFILSSSAAVYGNTGEYPITEDQNLAPLNPYGRSKVLAEEKVSILGAEFNLETICLRFFNIYGPGQPLGQSGLIPSFINSIKSGEDLIGVSSYSRLKK